MPRLTFRALHYWRWLLLHLLATGCLTLGIHQLMLVRAADVVAAYQRGGPEAVLQLPPNGQWESSGELLAYLWWVQLLPAFVALLAGGLLSALIVFWRRAPWTIPLIVALTHTLLNRLGLYDSAGVVRLESWAQLPGLPVSLATHFALAGALLLALSLLLWLLSARLRAAQSAGRAETAPVKPPSCA